MTSIAKPPLYRVALYQLALILPICGLLILVDETTAYSVLVGGLIQVGPQAWFARQAYRYTGATQVDQVVRAMYWGETGKVVLTAVLFVMAIVLFKPLNFLALLIAFVLMIPLQVFLTARLLRHERHITVDNKSLR